jgi:hypothetical protein
LRKTLYKKEIVDFQGQAARAWLVQHQVRRARARSGPEFPESPPC